MAKTSQMVDEQVVTTEKKKASTKIVRNKSKHRVELLVNGKIEVFLPGKSVEIPADAEVPTGLGLFVR